MAHLHWHRGGRTRNLPDRHVVRWAQISPQYVHVSGRIERSVVRTKNVRLSSACILI